MLVVAGIVIGLAGAVGWQRATGIDSFSGDGDKDGWRNLSGRLRGTYALSPSIELGAAAFALTLKAPRWWVVIHLLFSPLVVGARMLDIAPTWYLFAFLLLGVISGPRPAR